MSLSPAGNAPSAMRELNDLKAALAQTEATLMQQRDQLKQRGMTLPPTVLSGVAAIQAEVAHLEALFFEEDNEISQLRALADMSAALTTTLDVDTVLQEALDIVILLTRAERGFLILLDADSGELVFRIIRDQHPPKGGSSGTPQISRSIVNEVLRTRKPLLTDNAFQDERLSSNMSIANFALRSVLCVPLLRKEEVIGVVYVDNRLQAGIFTERELNTMTAFANTASVAITNVMLFEEIQQLLAEITQVRDLMDNIFASIGSGVIATDRNDIVTTFNRAAEEVLGVSAQASIGKPLHQVLPTLPFDLSDQIDAVLRDNRSQVLEIDLTTSGRGRIAVMMHLNPLKDSSGNVQGVAMVLDDITEQRQREQQLKTVRTYLSPEMVDNIQAISSLALGGENREITCLFAEVRALATMKDTPPREVLDILNEYFSIATDCVTDTFGIVDKYMGTELMALYNSQLIPQQNHAALALEAALMMRDAFVQLYERKGIQPQPHFYRIGIHTGIATLGNVGSLSRRDFTAIGDTINLAKRLQENAKSGQIIVSEVTHAQLSANLAAAYRFEELPPIQVKGRQQRTRMYEVFRA